MRLKEILARSDAPPELRMLAEFEAEHGFGEYSRGFGLMDEISPPFEGPLGGSRYADVIIPFAQANESGSTYFFWRYDEHVPLDEAPIAVYGDEGGAFVVSENMSRFLELLTFDGDVTVGPGGVKFYREDEMDGDEPPASEFGKEFREWAMENFGIEPCDLPEKVVREAQDSFQYELQQWLQELGYDALYELEDEEV